MTGVVAQGSVILLPQDLDASTDGVRFGILLVCVSFGSTEDLSDLIMNMVLPLLSMPKACSHCL